VTSLFHGEVVESRAEVLALVYIGGIPGAIALMLGGVCVVGTFEVTMVLSLLYLPRPASSSVLRLPAPAKRSTNAARPTPLTAPLAD
jgi:hypothetical protein